MFKRRSCLALKRKENKPNTSIKQNPIEKKNVLVTSEYHLKNQYEKKDKKKKPQEKLITNLQCGDLTVG